MNSADLAVLVSAIRFGSLAAAARHLGITPMVASRRLAALETELNVRLLYRTTRALSLTPEGESFLPFAKRLLEDEADALAAIRPVDAAASGLLRITASGAFGRRVITPMLAGFMRDNPEVQVDLQFSDRVVDIVAAGIDLAIRIAPLRDNTLIARRIADSRRILCAAPSYLSRHPAPGRLAELTAHQCLLASGNTSWTFHKDGGSVQQRVAGRLTSSSIETLHQACIDGFGIGLLSHWYVKPDIAAGRLVELPLADATPEHLDIWAVYPSARLVSPKVRLFIEALTQHLGSARG
ncbi:LysR family transcriptional regulator [Pseudodonghicola flavimaris]|uniref:LysR family transcriptional regulator n=1 Tax=Pseudodonghicola flavimaris TaxID=3050036 RepID=A0ABT7F897_9RHOB|nr:LysR family transcriptional regulator [Pseudodonghicola flavimaris]MDK3020822.1 LysR family transcriptional regulator [Pseudodonghicola flavimaris]